MIRINNLRKYDLHTHSFSHCVFCKRNEVPWDEIELSYDEKNKYIEKSLNGIVEQSIKRGIKTLGLSEHPQFMRYDVNYSDYKSILDNMKSSYPELKILSGIELNVIKGMGIMFDDFITDSKSINKILSKLQFITLGIHRGITKTSNLIWRKFNNKKEYLDTLIGAVKEIRAYYDGPVILAHPWRSAALGVNSLGESFGGYFTSSELKEIASTLIDNKVVPEFNGSSISSGTSDLFFEEGSILLSYIVECEHRGIEPVISVGSDGHTYEDIGKTYWEEVDKKLDLNGRVKIWSDILSEN